MRNSTITTAEDAGGNYEIEWFEAARPKLVIICAHGNGVRRWDGEQFFYAVAEHFADAAVCLVDQNQPDGEGVRLNPLPVLVSRVADRINEASARFPGVPIVVVAHSMGCGVASQLPNTDKLKAMFFVAPAAGAQGAKQVERYGADIARGKWITSSDNLRKYISAAYYASVKDIVWEEEYAKLLARFPEVHAFESGAEEIVGDERFQHRSLPFASYHIVPGATHNLSGEPLNILFGMLDEIIAIITNLVQKP